MKSTTFPRKDSGRKAYVVTGPTSGIGRATAFQLAKRGTVVLVGRDSKKLKELQGEIEREGGQAVSVVCDLSDMTSVRRAADSIVDLQLPLAGLFNNAGLHQTRPTKSVQGWDQENGVRPSIRKRTSPPRWNDGNRQRTAIQTFPRTTTTVLQ